MRTLIVGFGERGRRRREAAGASVVAIVDPNAPEAHYQDIANVPPSLYDAAIVCTPDSCKIAILKSLLSHSKHAMVEEPLAGTLSQLRELGGLSRANRVALYTAYGLRFEPQIVGLKQLIDEGKLGKIHLARFFRGVGNEPRYQRPSVRDKGAGVLSAVGSPLVDLSQFLLGAPKHAFELWNHHRFENRACDHALFGVPGEPAIEIEATFISCKNSFTIDVFGEHGSAHVQGLCHWGHSSLIHRNRVPSSVLPVEETRILEQADPTPRLEFEHFRHLAKTGGSNIGNDIKMVGTISALLREVGPGFEE